MKVRSPVTAPARSPIPASALACLAVSIFAGGACGSMSAVPPASRTSALPTARPAVAPSTSPAPPTPSAAASAAASAKDGIAVPARLEDTPPSSAVTDALFVIVDSQDEYGFIDASGKVVITPQFDEVGPFQEGLAAFRQGKRWGFIERSGKVVLAPKWQSVSAFSEGLAAVVSREKEVVTGSGKLIASDTGYVDRSGKYVIPSRFRLVAGDFISGMAAIAPEPGSEESRRGMAYYLLRNGKAAFPSLKLSAALPFSGGMAMVLLLGEDGKERSTFVDTQGQLLTFPPGFELAGEPGSGLIPAHNEATGQYAYIDPSGKIVFTLEAQEVNDFSEGLAVVQVKGKYGYIRPDGTWAVPPKYLCAEPFFDGVARVCGRSAEDERYINAAGHVVILAGAGCPWIANGGANPAGAYHGGLQYRNLGKQAGECAAPGISKAGDAGGVYGYRNKAGKYVWVSPGAETRLGDSFWKNDYVGPPRAP
jgi:hypothetical protein